MTNELYAIGKAFIRDRKISLTEPGAVHPTSPNEAYFVCPLKPEIKKKDGKDVEVLHSLRVVVQYRALKKAVAVMWREPEGKYEGFQLATAEAQRLGGKTLDLDPKNTRELPASTAAETKV